MIPAKLGQFEKANLDLCKGCFEKSLDEVIKMKKVAYRSDTIFGFWKYRDIKFS